MRKAPLVLLTWVLGTAGSVLVGSLGVQLVTSAVSPGRVSPLTRPEVLAALSMDPAALGASVVPPAHTHAAADAGPGAGAPPADPPEEPAPGLPPSAPGLVPAAGPPGSASAPASAEPSGDRGTGREGSSTSGIEPRSAGSREGSRDGPGSASTVQSFVRTIRSDGGTVAVRYGAGKAVLDWARPNLGFEARVVSRGPVVEVEFESRKQESRVRAWWGDRGPRQDVRESKSDPDDGDRDRPGR